MSKIRPYEVEVHGVKVKVSVVSGNDRLIVDKVSELKASLQSSVMGLNIKTVDDNYPQMLLVCAEGRCLIIPKLPKLYEYHSAHYVSQSSIGRLLSDQSICFVGMNFRSSYSSVQLSTDTLTEMVSKAGVELGYLAAMILKKPTVQNKQLYELADEAGVDIKPLSGAGPNLDAEIFSNEEIKYLIHDVYGSYLVVNKLLGMLEA